MLSKSRVPGWNWLLQRITAILLAVGLLGHFLVLHYSRLFSTKALTAPASTAWRFASSPIFWMVFDGILLAAGLYHAFNGAYNVICDYNPKPCTRRWLAWGLWIVGIIAFGLGLAILGRFIGFSLGKV